MPVLFFYLRRCITFGVFRELWENLSKQNFQEDCNRLKPFVQVGFFLGKNEEKGIKFIR